MVYRVFFKRLFDLVISLVALICLSPVFIVIIILLFFLNRGGIFFHQERPGKNEKIFTVIKFKSMNDRRGADGKLLPDHVRLTKFGKFIRQASLDELPQIFNVIAGNMSLIGPRPLLSKYLPLYSAEQKRRHSVRPGITGWAQVNGRNSIRWTDKFALDVFYVDNISFLLDIKILWLTVLKVTKQEGINQSENRPMLPFDGTN